MSGEIHPLGVRPSGNALTSSREDVERRVRTKEQGLGALATLGDTLLLRVLESCAPRTLAALAQTSKAMRAFATHADVWKAAVLETFGGRFRYDASWFGTFATAAERERRRDGDDVHASKRAKAEPAMARPRTSVSAEIYSDALHQRYMCASMELEAEWLEVSTVPEETSGELSVRDFVAKYEAPNVPVVIRGAAKDWRATQTWTRESLVEKFGDVDFVVGGYDMKLDDFFTLDACEDDVPLYLFDPNFGEKVPELVSDYDVPEYFAKDDLFSLMGADRPHYRWLIVGAARSGSSFHKDPNATSAWNAVITGRKKWVMFPPHVNPPGVHPSEDGAHVAAPLSLVEWFSNFYQYAYDGDVKPLECICEPGDILFVPSGWWHMALNLEECVAITQNFVSKANLRKVIAVLDTKCEALLSGLDKSRRGSLGELFNEALKSSPDDEVQSILTEYQSKKAAKVKPSALGDAFAAGASFSFSFV